MRRVVIDTNLYIDWLNAGRHEAVLFEREAVKYLSAVVVLELYAGALSRRDRGLVRGVVAAFERADRILVPAGGVYEDGGHVLRTLQASRGYRGGSGSSLVNDVLIALSARSIGATVVTSSGRDFAAIRAIRPFKLNVVTQ
ncbi:MAG: type II toxin-antitoxin system VapC family toxin [Candidatus Rokuibacteriota bacterium]